MHNSPGALLKALGRAGVLLLVMLGFATAPASAEDRNDGDKRLRFAESARAVMNGAYVPNFQIATVKVDGADEYLTNYPNGAADPEWSRDGSRIYFEAIAFNDAYDALFWVPSGGGVATQVQTGCGDDPDCLGDDNPAVSPNGRRLLTNRAFLPISPEGNASNCSIFKMGIDGSGPGADHVSGGGVGGGPLAPLVARR